MTYQRSIEVDAALRERSLEQASHAVYRAQGAFGSLDALRALSILAVLWHHASTVPAGLMERFPALKYGFLGVDLFFVLSGFLIVTLLLRERERHGRISLKNFYVRRALRIFPLYYGLLAGYALLYFVLRPQGSGAEGFRHDLPALLLYLTNWTGAAGMLSITWSLAAEEQFYLFWPPVERFVGRAWLPLVLTLILLSELIPFGVLDSQLEAWFGFTAHQPSMLRQTTFAPICLGVLLAHTLHERAGFERVIRVVGHRAAAPLLLATIVIGANFLPPEITGGPRLLTHLLMVSFLASVVVREDHGLARLCHLRPLVRIGALSYGIYLLHMPLLGLINAILDRFNFRLPFADVLLGTALVVAVAELSFRYYETPFLKLKHRFAG